jgi:prepilin-type N-terminal cleavage/methylation domain-containing protein
MPSRAIALASVRKKQDGFTLTEAAIVLAIIGLILGAIWGAAAMMMEKYREQRAVNQIIAIFGKYQQLYPNVSSLSSGGPPNPPNDLTCLGMLAGAFPPDMLTTPNFTCVTFGNSSYPESPSGDSAYPTTPWGGTSTVVVWAPVTNKNMFTIDYSGISSAGCVVLAMAALSIPGMTSISVSYTTESGTTGVGWAAPFSPTSPTVTAIGNACGSSNENESAVELQISE